MSTEPRRDPEGEPIPDPLAASSPLPASTASSTGVAWKVTLAAIAAGALASVATIALRAPQVSLLPPPEVTVTEVTPTPDVVTAIRGLARLESVAYHVERVVDLADHQKHLYGLVDAKDAILLVAVGDVVAGCDLGELQKDDVESDWESRKITVHLPAPKVLSSGLDEKATHVFSRTTDTLAARHEDLEGRARQEALKTMQKAAEDQGLKDKARANAEAAVRGLLEAAGFKEIDISFKDGR